MGRKEELQFEKINIFSFFFINQNILENKI